MRYASVSQNIQYVCDLLAPVTQMENIEKRTGERVVTYSGRLPGILNRTYYPLEYQFLLDRQQYSLLLSDGSFFQFYYAFDAEDRLSAARLAFYPPPISTHDDDEALIEAAEKSAESEDEFLFEHLNSCVELIDALKIHPANTGHFRFDYDPTAKGTHAISHLQFSGVNNIRLSASFFPMPSAFIEMISSGIANLPALDGPCIGHARNNALRTDAGDGLIYLSHEE
ncbi:DUF2290 domain-containing protein [Pandoraea apista]|uniref:DUF2290 domain-containing protein n=1 Tax=Pandoraea apista TaxID=93218 RepID=UPI00248E1E81|nr:DUF2290 domain-containing protein [Pandoraea apista]